MSVCIQIKSTYYGVSIIYKTNYAEQQILVARKKTEGGGGNTVTYNGLLSFNYYGGENSYNKLSEFKIEGTKRYYNIQHIVQVLIKVMVEIVLSKIRTKEK